MTTRSEVQTYAGELSACEGQELIASYERWFRQRGDRQAARYWRLNDKVFAQLAAENYADAEALRTQLAQREA